MAFFSPPPIYLIHLIKLQPFFLLLLFSVGFKNFFPSVVSTKFKKSSFLNIRAGFSPCNWPFSLCNQKILVLTLETCAAKLSLLPSFLPSICLSMASACPCSLPSKKIPYHQISGAICVPKSMHLVLLGTHRGCSLVPSCCLSLLHSHMSHQPAPRDTPRSDNHGTSIG